jgi:hypothetical protein
MCQTLSVALPNAARIVWPGWSVRLVTERPGMTSKTVSVAVDAVKVVPKRERSHDQATVPK